MYQYRKKLFWSQRKEPSLRSPPDLRLRFIRDTCNLDLKTKSWVWCKTIQIDLRWLPSQRNSWLYLIQINCYLLIKLYLKLMAAWSTPEDRFQITWTSSSVKVRQTQLGCVRIETIKKLLFVHHVWCIQSSMCRYSLNTLGFLTQKFEGGLFGFIIIWQLW